MPNHDSPSGGPRCLLVTKEFSLTPTSGGMLRTLALAEQLRTHYETTVVSPAGVWVASRDGGPGENEFAAAALQTRVDGRWQRLPAVSDLTRYRSISGVRTGGRALLRNIAAGAHGHYELGVLDHTCLAGLTDALAIGCDTVVVSMHNLESDLMAQRAAAATDAKEKAVMTLETRLLRRLEAHVVQSYPVVVCTAADAAALAEGHRPEQLIVCRNGIFPNPNPPAVDRDPNAMVFSGARDGQPKGAGLVWFAEQAWPLIRAAHPTATVTIAGRNPEPVVLKACDRPGIRLLANPPVMSTVVEAHPLGIVPLLSGGGSRIKILEYMASGVDVVSTDVGASGLEDIPDTFVDRTPVDPRVFADRVVQRLREPRDNAVAAQDWVRKNYAWDVTLQPLLDAVHQ